MELAMAFIPIPLAAIVAIAFFITLGKVIKLIQKIL